VELQARFEGYGTVDEYVAKVLLRHLEGTRDKIDQALIEGLESGDPVEVNEAFWKQLRLDVQTDIKKAKKESA
jgi:hypothetical protein